MKERWLFSFDALKQRLVLTREEKRAIIFIVVAFALGLTARHYRNADSPAPDKIEKKHSDTHAQGAPTSPSVLPKRTPKQPRMKNRDARRSPTVNEVKGAPE